jgi:hypothetical protein
MICLSNNSLVNIISSIIDVSLLVKGEDKGSSIRGYSDRKVVSWVKSLGVLGVLGVLRELQLDNRKMSDNFR